MKHIGPIHGIIAEYADPTSVVEAARRAYAAGFRKMDGYSPYPIDELSEAIGFHKTRVPLVVLIGGLLGALTGYGLQYYCSKIAYPLNIGGRPLNSWPSFIIITFELTILFAAISAVVGMIAMNGLPMPYHPVFNVPGFELASKDRFYLCIEAEDPMFDRAKTADFLRTTGAREVTEVAA